MSFYWILSTVAAAAAAVTGAHSSSGQGSEVINDVVITAESGRPTVSGFDRTWVALQMRTPDARNLEMYMPYMTEDQFVPSVNSVCNIRFHTAFTDGLIREREIPRDRELDIIDEITCGSGRFVMIW